MKLTFFDDYQLGIITGDKIVEISRVSKQIEHSTPQQLMNEIIARFSDLAPELEKALGSNQGIPISQVRIRPPLPRPGKIICAAVNYLEFGTRPPSPLEAFIKSSNSVIGNGDTVELPNIPATIFHHEAELAVVIGKLAKNVTAAQSMDYVFGYTNFMDVSARGFAPLGPGRMSFFMIKSSDTFGPMGPCIVSKDEIDDPHDLNVKLWNKGEIRHDFNTSDMSNRIPELIEYCSSITSLEPGDIISTGTNHQGIGAIQDGDQLLMEIKEIGQLAVNVTDAQKRSWPRGIDQDMANAMRGDKKP
jgi:2-keto-4-pentenoate hydratase/2-oxohepta-3-ene-1,7-dioic acid hydratase in catechol pathway